VTVVEDGVVGQVMVVVDNVLEVYNSFSAQIGRLVSCWLLRGVAMNVPAAAS